MEYVVYNPKKQTSNELFRETWDENVASFLQEVFPNALEESYTLSDLRKIALMQSITDYPDLFQGQNFYLDLDFDL